VHLVIALLNKHKLEIQNGIATAENCVCVVVLGVEVCDVE